MEFNQSKCILLALTADCQAANGRQPANVNPAISDGGTALNNQVGLRLKICIYTLGDVNANQNWVNG